MDAWTQKRFKALLRKWCIRIQQEQEVKEQACQGINS
jgi:hypothetical protein